MKRISRVLVGVAACLVVPAIGSATPVVANGSFEADPFSGSGTLGLGCLNTLTDWVAHCSSDSTYPWGLKNGNVFNAGPTPYGNQWVIVGDFGAGGSDIQQSVSGFDAGSKYTLNFALASEGFAGGSQVEISFPSGSSTPSAIFTAPLRGANYWDNWGTFSYDFLANAGTVTFRITGLADDGALDAGVDNVSITAGTAVIPEPTSMLLMGTGLVGIARRLKTRRRNVL